MAVVPLFATATALSEPVPEERPPIPGSNLEPKTDSRACAPNTDDDASVTTCGCAASRPPALHSSCPPNMVEVIGEYCPALELVCEKYISEPRDRCERFRTRARCYGRPRAHRLCIDRYEYPNQAGVHPVVGVTWDQAWNTCDRLGKRLCTAEEWTLACEGPERLPHPYGYVRDSTACNIDRPYIMPNDAAYDDPARRAAEIARLSQSEPSGWRERCVSAYGVHDMTGNVDEWVLNEEGTFEGPEFDSGLKGGYWGPVRNRCRPMTTDHNHWHNGYQIGFRCCSEMQDKTAAPECGDTVETTVSPELLAAAAIEIAPASMKAPTNLGGKPKYALSTPSEASTAAAPRASAGEAKTTLPAEGQVSQADAGSLTGAGGEASKVGEDESDTENPY
jgi:formylglycine-generating enzyme